MEIENKLIYLLIVDEDFHKADQITSSLRATGLQVRAEFAEDGEDMAELLDKNTFDLVLFCMDLPAFGIAAAQQLIAQSGKQVGLIALAKEVDSTVIVDAIKHGARDALSREDNEHFIQVITREANFIQLWRRASRLESDLQESEQRCRNLLRSSKDAVAYVHEGMHIFANQSYMDLFGHADFEELEGTTFIDMVDISQKDELKAFLRDQGNSGNEPRLLELNLVNSGGDKLSATVEFSPASYEAEPCTQLMIRSDDGTAQLEEQINYLHQHDLISGLYNRQFFMTALKKAIGQAVSGRQQFAIIYFAIDNFQSIRDTIGISGCDVLIKDVAQILTDNAGPEYTLARFGACSYACIARLEEKQLIEQYAATISALVEQHISEIGNQSISATCSSAIVFVDENSPTDPNALMSRAEKTCEDIQKKGGNQSRTFIPQVGEMTVDEADGITADLIKEALNQNRIKGLYQPIVGVKSQEGERYQSSIEISTAEGHILGEDEYESAAERTGTAKMLDRWKILHAIKKISETSKQERPIEIFIPLSADSTMDSGLALWVSQNIEKAKISGRQLVFMVNEAQVLSQLKAAKNLTMALKQFDCQFAINEFGAGQNPFQLVKHIGADYVRVNRGFMDGLSQNSENQDNIRELTNRAGDLELKTITPGVTDAAILSVLWTLNVDFIQGNFLQGPKQELDYDFSSV
jgi:diguanylate cyclase (GGDEF)-like protein/PAS domain S-box-containing protein